MFIILLPLLILSAFATPLTLEFYKKNDYSSRRSFDGEDCRNKIRDLVCIVIKADPESIEERTCLEGSDAYAHHFETIHDNFPSILQKVFCSLDHIYIETEFHGTAYAGTIKNGSTVLGIRKSVLDENLDLAHWASWKEQLSFSPHLNPYEIQSDLVQVSTSTSQKVNNFLYFVIAHEFGHILDFSNKVNEYKGDCPDDQDESSNPGCEMREDSWGGISWISDTQPKPQNDFSHQRELCFYWCEANTLSPSVMAQIYEDLFERTDFISIYATTQPWDDFADSMAYVLIHQHLESTYVLNTVRGKQFNVMEKLESPLFAKKLKFINNFMMRQDLIYP